jgi:hypothetical protein
VQGHPLVGWYFFANIPYDDHRKKTEEDQYLISPLTGEKIPAAKAAEHMKVCGGSFIYCSLFVVYMCLYVRWRNVFLV